MNDLLKVLHSNPLYRRLRLSVFEVEHSSQSGTMRHSSMVGSLSTVPYTCTVCYAVLLSLRYEPNEELELACKLYDHWLQDSTHVSSQQLVSRSHLCIL